jgi:hypothetical protein
MKKQLVLFEVEKKKLDKSIIPPLVDFYYEAIVSAIGQFSMNEDADIFQISLINYIDEKELLISFNAESKIKHSKFKNKKTNPADFNYFGYRKIKNIPLSIYNSDDRYVKNIVQNSIFAALNEIDDNVFLDCTASPFVEIGIDDDNDWYKSIKIIERGKEL